MKMMLINDDDSKTKVEVSTLHSNVVFIIDSKTQKTVGEMRDPEILFFGDEMNITGYIRRDWSDKHSYFSKTFTLKSR